MFETHHKINKNTFPLFKMLIDINEKMLEAAPYDTILEFLFETLDAVIPYDRIGIALLEKDGNAPGIKMNWVKSKGEVKNLSLPYFSSTISASLQNILDSNKPRIINDLERYLSENPTSVPTQLIIRDGIRSSLTCPVRLNNKAIGVIFFSSFSSGVYSQDHIEIFQQIATEISVIINYGRLQKTFKHSQVQNRNVHMTLHDLKSPLGVLQGFAEIAIERPWFSNLDPEAKLVFQTFFKNTKYMLQLVNDLSDIAFLENGREHCEIKKSNLQDFLSELQPLIQAMASQKEISLQVNLSPLFLPLFAYFDPHKIKRVLINLISNAIKFSKRKSNIIFTLNSSENRLIFSVQDQGQGIPENEMNQLFQEFGKTSVRPTEDEGSTGQGLAIAKKIIDQHQGKFSVISTVGQGSTFSFWIPIEQKMNAP